MIIAAIDTDTLPKEFVMAWTGIITPSLHYITWVAPSINSLEIRSTDAAGKPYPATHEDFEAIRCADDLHMEAVRNECFPCVPCIWNTKMASVDRVEHTIKLFVMVPVSELRRCGLME